MQFDIAILDPPYRKGMHEKLLPLLAEHMADNGIVICEHETGLEMPQSVGVLEQKKQKKYGAITVTTYICRRAEIHMERIAVCPGSFDPVTVGTSGYYHPCIEAVRSGDRAGVQEHHEE